MKIWKEARKDYEDDAKYSLVNKLRFSPRNPESIDKHKINFQQKFINKTSVFNADSWKLISSLGC